MDWKKLDNIYHLEEIDSESASKPILIFKHSTRCPVSFAALDRIEGDSVKLEGVNFEPYFLDLISYRSVSNEIAEKYGITHQSPQILIIKNGKVTYHNSHMGVNINNIKNSLI